MHTRSSATLNRFLSLILVAGLLAGAPVGSLAAASATRPPEAPLAAAVQPEFQSDPAAPLDIPETLVDSGVTRFTMTDPKVFWYTGVPICPPPEGEGQTAAPGQDYHETIQRVATYGSPPRTLYDELVDCSGDQVLSNIVADDDFIYWIGPIGLMKLSTDANPGDPAQLMNALIQPPGEIADGGDRIYAIYDAGVNKEIAYVRKDNHARVFVNSGNNAFDLQAQGDYIYYRVGGDLMRQEPGVDIGVLIAEGVTGYYPEGSRLIFCLPPTCYFSDNVYVGQGDQIRIYDNLDETLGPAIYTSVDPDAGVYALVTDVDELFFFESRPTECSPFCVYVAVLQRTGRGGGDVDPIYTYDPPTLFELPNDLFTDGDFLFWHDDDQVLRLPNNALALPQVNLVVTGMEVIQSVQNLANSVPLIQGKRTFVRVFANAEGASTSAVTASLTNTASSDVSLQPVNPAGTKITVRANPDRDDIDQSFLFELPWSWLQDDSLHLQVNLNPYKVPLEPTYTDNLFSADLPLVESPDLSVEFFPISYQIGSEVYEVRDTDLEHTFSWIQRAYPIGGAVGEHFKPRVFWLTGGPVLGTLVDQSNPVCDLLYGGPNDDPALCASHIVNEMLWGMRIEAILGIDDYGLKPNAFYYGLISDAAAFPRGQAMYYKTSVGPAGPTGGGWDTDGSYADWYAGHEIGHSLGRDHPIAGSDNPATPPPTRENCQHSRTDLSFPYGNTTTSSAPIGPADGSLEGFDAGDPSLGIPMAVLPSDTWNDLMSYCNNQWISDYTYLAMYNNMINNPSAAGAGNTALLAGDYLAAAGVIATDGDAAVLSYMHRLDAVANPPDIIPGDYSLRLLDGTGSILAETAFTPAEILDAGGSSFSLVVDFVAGTTQAQVVRLSDDTALATRTVSTNPPSVSDVSLVGSSNPVTGTVVLEWQASDPDGDALSFDVAYSRDGGITFLPVALGLTSSEADIDTTALGGSGTALFRVTASDGVNTASADSPIFVMASKLPMPVILSPAGGLQVHWGQLVNFSGMALDVQDGTVAGGGLGWFDADNTLLGIGPLLSLTDLPVGANEITLRATNSAGETDSAVVTVFVDDDLTLPGPTLTAGPSTLGWHVSAGSTDLQTAELSINNAGSGDMDWTAASSADWLTLSAASGTVSAEGDPSVLTVTADPVGLADDTGYSAQIILTNLDSDSPLDQVVINVSLSIGNIRGKPPLNLFIKVFLPAMLR